MWKHRTEDGNRASERKKSFVVVGVFECCDCSLRLQESACCVDHSNTIRRSARSSNLKFVISILAACAITTVLFELERFDFVFLYFKYLIFLRCSKSVLMFV